MSEDCLLRFPFLFYALYILLLCVHKEVARNAPALHAGSLAFFYEKSLAKKLFICLSSSFFPLWLLLVRGSRLSCSLFCIRCVYRDLSRRNIVFIFSITSQVKSVYLGSGVGKHAASIALRCIFALLSQRTDSHVREAPRHAIERFSRDALSALCGHCIKHSQTGELHRYTFER